MPFYIRKSINAGIFRFNLSKSGIGVSTGIRGFRIGSGPKGNYIHMGSNGLYYRETLSNKRNNYSSANPSNYSFPPLNSQFTEIKSADVLRFKDASSEKLLSEINQKYKVPDYWLTVSLLSIICLFYSIVPIENMFTFIGLEFGSIHLFVIYGLGFLFIAALSFLLYDLNQEQKNIILFYTMDDELESAYQAVHDAFNKVRSCKRQWRLMAQSRVYGAHQIKLSSGAGTLIKRQQIALSNSAPKWIKTNIAVPAISTGRQVLYFFPDRLLIQEGKKFGAIQYGDLEIGVTSSRFVETEGLPSDANVVGKTWKYPNKDGSPDRRFNNNYEIPITIYSELHFTSPQGLHEIVQLSKSNEGGEFAESVKKLGVVLKNSLSKKNSQTMNSRDMEKDVVEFYNLLGYEILQTKKQSESTIDIFLSGKQQQKWITRFENINEITPEIMRDFQDMVNREKPLKAGLIVNGVFSPNAKKIAEDMIKDNKIILVDKNQFYEQLSHLRAKREKV